MPQFNADAFMQQVRNTPEKARLAFLGMTPTQRNTALTAMVAAGFAASYLMRRTTNTETTAPQAVQATIAPAQNGILSTVRNMFVATPEPVVAPVVATPVVVPPTTTEKIRAALANGLMFAAGWTVLPVYNWVLNPFFNKVLNPVYSYTLKSPIDWAAETTPVKGIVNLFSWGKNKAVAAKDAVVDAVAKAQTTIANISAVGAALEKLKAAQNKASEYRKTSIGLAFIAATLVMHFTGLLALLAETTLGVKVIEVAAPYTAPVLETVGSAAASVQQSFWNTVPAFKMPTLFSGWNAANATANATVNGTATTHAVNATINATEAAATVAAEALVTPVEAVAQTVTTAVPQAVQSAAATVAEAFAAKKALLEQYRY